MDRGSGARLATRAAAAATQSRALAVRGAMAVAPLVSRSAAVVRCDAARRLVKRARHAAHGHGAPWIQQ